MAVQAGRRTWWISGRVASSWMLLFLASALLLVGTGCQVADGHSDVKPRVASTGAAVQGGGSSLAGSVPSPSGERGSRLAPSSAQTTSRNRNSGRGVAELAGAGRSVDQREDGKGVEPGYVVRVSIAEQKVRVYRGNKLVREMISSTGTQDKPTPTGRFRIQNRGEWFFSEKYQQGAKYWVSFKDWGVYLFHSIPMDRYKCIIQEEAAKLGQRASHGCVRLSVEDARWFYETIPYGTPVEVY